MGSLLNILVPLLAVFIVYRLFTTLGKNGEDENNNNFRNDDRFDNQPENDNVINLPTARKNANDTTEASDPIEILANAIDTKNFANADNSAKAGLQQIIMSHPSFDYRQFMNGAEVAYEMINLSFAENDRNTLKKLLTPKVYASFDSVMTAREQAEQRVNSRFVGYERVQLKTATLEGTVAILSVHFISKLISTTYDKHDTIIDGDEKHIFNTNDVWTFETDMKNNNTSWQLSATAKG